MLVTFGWAVGPGSGKFMADFFSPSYSCLLLLKYWDWDGVGCGRWGQMMVSAGWESWPPGIQPSQISLTAFVTHNYTEWQDGEEVKTWALISGRHGSNSIPHISCLILSKEVSVFPPGKGS